MAAEDNTLDDEKIQEIERQFSEQGNRVSVLDLQNTLMSECNLEFKDDDETVSFSCISQVAIGRE